jgi:protein SCO1
MIAAAASIMLVVPGLASAKSVHVHGVILAVAPKTGEVIVRHDSFGSMPSMTMPFHVAPRERLRELQQGAEINASLDTAHAPWTLSNISVVAVRTVTSAPALRRVQPLGLGDALPEPPLIDEHGVPFRFAALRGQDVVLAFIYTRCRDPQMCPLISAKFNALQHKIGARPLHLVEVTLDPSYDRPDVLERYGRAFGADPRRWTMAVGDVDPTRDFASKFGVTEIPDRNIGLIHSENTVLIGPDGRIRNMILDNAWQPDELLAEIDASRGEVADPIARLNLWLSNEAVAFCGNSIAGFSGFSDVLIVLVLFGSAGTLIVRVVRVFAKGV